jgi:PAS domain S-box-containing protein
MAAENVALEHLKAACSRLWAIHDEQEGLDEILTTAMELLGSDMGFVQIVDEEREVLTVTSQRGFGQGGLEPFREGSALDDSACGRALRSGERISIEDVETDERFAPLRRSARAARYRAMQFTPLLGQGGRPLGAISIHFRSPCRPSQQELYLLDVCAYLAAEFLVRCRTYKLLRLGEERMQLTLAAGRLGIWEWTIATDAIYCSPEIIAIAGVAANEFGGTRDDLSRRIHPDDRVALWKKVTATLADGESPFEHEFRIVRPDGAVRWLMNRAELIRDESGRAARIVGVVADVTDRKRSEEELKASEAKHIAVFRALAEGVVFLNPKGEVVEANDAVSRLHGRRFDDLTHAGRDPRWRAIRPDGTPFPAEEQPAIRALRTGQPVRDVEMGFRTSGGTIAWQVVNAQPVYDERGTLLGVVASFFDITERKRAEEALHEREARLSAILNTATDAVVTIDRRGIIEGVNPAAERLFGYRGSEMVGQNVKLLMPSPYREHHDEYLARYFRTGEARIIGIGREVLARRRDGTVFPIELAVSEIDHFHRFTGFIRDLTRRKQLEREVVEVSSQEQRRIGQDLHDTVAQELTALNILAADLAEILQPGPADATLLAQRLVRGLRLCQEQLRSVIRGLLPVPVIGDGLMAALADLAERTQESSKVDCVFKYANPVILTDNLTATHLYLIAQEAVHNALKHARARTILISLANDAGLVLRVSDDGIGMPSSRGSVAGLGLRIMRSRAAIIGARLTFEAVAPTGTVVTCEFKRGPDA